MNMIKALIIISIVSLIGCAAPTVPQGDLGPQVLDQVPEYPTLLKASARGATEKVILRMVSTGKGINEKAGGTEEDDDYGFTPLHYAALERKMPIIKALVDAGADKTAKDGFGDLALTALPYNDELSSAEKVEIYLLLGGDKNDDLYGKLTDPSGSS